MSNPLNTSNILSVLTIPSSWKVFCRNVQYGLLLVDLLCKFPPENSLHHHPGDLLFSLLYEVNWPVIHIFLNDLPPCSHSLALPMSGSIEYIFFASLHFWKCLYSTFITSFLLINFKVQVTSENSESIVPFSSFYGASIQKNNAILILDPLTANFFFLSGKFENNFVPNILKF